MRVAVNATFVVPYVGGTQVYLENLIREMTRLDTRNQYDLFVTEFSGRYFPKDRPNISFHRVRSAGWGRVARILWEQYEFPRRLSRLGASLCFAPGYTAPVRARCPVVVTIHDMQWHHHPELANRVKAWYLGRMVTAAARRADAIVTVSEYSRRDIVESLGVNSSRVRAIHLAPSAAVEPPRDPVTIVALKRRLGIRGEYVLYLGRFNPHKGVPVLLRAFDRAKEDPAFPQTLVLAGRRARGLPEILETIAELKLADSVLFTDFLPDADLGPLYAGASCFVLPSTFEGFGLPVLEAMKCGTPVVCARTTALPEIGGDAALYFEPGDWEQLARRMSDVVLPGEARRGAIEAGYRRVSQFSWERSARETLALFEEIARR